MTSDDTPDNIKQFSLNLVPPTEGKDKDKELRECLDKGKEILDDLLKKPNVQSFFVIILDDEELPSFLGAGEAQTLRTLGALEMAKNELLHGL